VNTTSILSEALACFPLSSLILVLPSRDNLEVDKRFRMREKLTTLLLLELVDIYDDSCSVVTSSNDSFNNDGGGGGGREL